MDEETGESGGESKRPRYAAHTPNDQGRWQSMDEHVGEVSRLAEEFATVFGCGKWGRWAGLLHDVGKYSDEFQNRLDRCYEAAQSNKKTPRERVDHKSAGARLAATELKNSPLSMAIFGHHGGLPSVADWTDSLKKSESLPGSLQSPEIAKRECPDLSSRPVFDLPECAHDRIQMELFIRMLYSCLVDADSLDTEAHFNPEKSRARGDETALVVYCDVLRERQTSLMSSLSNANSDVNIVRRDVYEACIRAAELPPGVFRLTVPTGGGKTRSSLAFALEHALRHGMERVIYAIPYTSIIDQTVNVFREIFGEGANSPRVLEHHSAVIEPTAEDGDTEMEDGRELWRRLAADNWDARLVVTTTVQLFESLFSRKPGRCRKVHRLARCVIVLDEVQTLPLTLLSPIVSALRTLTEQFGATVVLCTATQPALDIDSPYMTGFASGSVREIIPIEERNQQFLKLKRVHYRIESDRWSWEQVADEMKESPQCLTIVNTRKDALAILNALERCSTEDRLHLSTLLCGMHRRAVIDKVRRRLQEGSPIRLVSTQVVEAGVDLDFPKVLRAIGPLDRIIQAAGRCNREGKQDLGEVILFTPEEGGSPGGSYRVALDQAHILLSREGIDLNDPDVIERFFRDLYPMVNTDERKIMADRKDFDFPKVHEKFRMIQEDTVPVLAPYDRDLYNVLVETAMRQKAMPRDLWRKAQPLMVSMFHRDFADRTAIIEQVVPDFFVWRGEYDEFQGLVGVARDPSDLIFGT